jgi:hypothetical protein
VSAKHTLAARLRDLLIEFELWVATWLATSAALAASVSLYLQPVVNGELWRNYLLASVLDIVGLGSVSIPGWHNPAHLIQFVQEELPTEILTIWDRDLALILQSPVYAFVVLPLAYLIFFDKKV